MQILQHHYNEEFVLQFLTGLVCEILLIEPFPSISKVFNMIIQAENQRTLGTIPPIATTLTQPSTSNPSQPPKNKKPRPYCSNCHKLGHLVDKCFFIHGFLPGYDSKKNTNPTVNSTSLTTDTSTADASSINKLTTQCQHLFSLLSQQLKPNDSYPETQPVVSNFSGKGKAKLDQP
ncbi:uncharacterized protein LOC133788717 isoform X2 [Humulus lupulus]|uniref:uncharacterized protein LOC133788717 isoform X2 n=1 Tax=Humulus lupulus TaxID=3486 RepID=UPI002B40D873|nr:uncharacterized protein LOC133788717 isoform X2 [Humulus lupulus]